MSDLQRKLSLVFAAGCVGGLAAGLVLWASGAARVNVAFGFSVAPALTLGWLFPRIVWGGIWGALFLAPSPSQRWWVQGLILSLGPSLVHLAGNIPLKTPAGIVSHGFATPTFIAVLLINAVWGIAAAWWLSRTD